MSRKRMTSYVAALALAVAGGGLYGTGASVDDPTQTVQSLQGPTLVIASRPMESLSLNL